MPIAKIKVSGIVYEIDTDIVAMTSVHHGRKAGFVPDMIRNALKKGDDLQFTFNRPTDMFCSILGFYQTGELHMPMWICPGAFRKELDFWDIDTGCMEPCCRTRLNSFMDEQKLVTEFRKELDIGVLQPSSGLSWRQRVWLVVDNQSQSTLSRLYFALTLIAVLVSIIGIGLGTDSCCMRDITVCEMEEYMKSAKPEGYKYVLKRLNVAKCSETNLAQYFDDEDELHFYIKIPNPQGGSRPQNQPPQQQNHDGELTIPKLSRRLLVFDVIDYLTLVFFTFDFIFRLFTCPSLCTFIKSVVNYFDFFALIGTYLHLTISQLNKEEIYEDNWVDALEYLQVLRSLRLLRLVKNLRTSRVLVFSLRKNFKDLSILAMFLFIGVCTFGSLLYFSEDRTSVVSIPTGWWWSLVTMTTVGYGDVTPKSGPGRIIGSVCALSGVVLLSLTLPIFVNNFLTLYQYAEDGELQQKEKLKDKSNVSVTPVVTLSEEKKGVY